MNYSKGFVVRLATIGLAFAVAGLAFARQPVAAAPSTEANITRLTADVLAGSQFAHHPLDSELAGKFLDGYLDSLDREHTLFLKADEKEFAAYRATLAQITRQLGDTSAARAIWQRYLERLAQQAEYVSEVLKTEHFTFTGRDRYFFEREAAPRPRDIDAAKRLWRERLRAEYLDEKLRDTAPEKIKENLNHKYEQQLKVLQTLRGNDILEIYLNALAHVYDPHSDYLGHEQMESLAIAMKLSLVGVGASLAAEDGCCEVRELVPGGPAARSGQLQPGDRIVAVAQGTANPVDVVNLPISRAVELIRGAKGSAVTLTVQSADDTPAKQVSLVRQEIQLEDQRAKATIIDLPSVDGQNFRVGVLDLPSFYASEGGRPGTVKTRSVAADVAQLLTKLESENVQGLIVDLRRNGGGSLDEAIRLTGLFIPHGPVVQTRGPEGDIEVDADNDPSQLWQGPMVLLTSRFSASASEILAGALQDYGRALVVGDSSTFGKGTVQSILPLDRLMNRNRLAYDYDPGALKVTIRKFYRPSGASTQLRGVSSDIVLPSTTDFSDISEGAMKDPLPWDSVPAAPHVRFNRVAPFLATLKQKSAQRIAHDPEFAYLKEDIARTRRRVATKSVSLNEAERRQDLARAKVRQAQREKERSARKAAKPVGSATTRYAITVDSAAQPGLPAPVSQPSTPDGASTSKPGAAPSAKGDTGDTGDTGSDEADDVLLNEAVQIVTDYARLYGPARTNNVSAR